MLRKKIENDICDSIKVCILIKCPLKEATFLFLLRLLNFTSHKQYKFSCTSHSSPTQMVKRWDEHMGELIIESL